MRGIWLIFVLNYYLILLDSVRGSDVEDCGIREVVKDDPRTLSPWTVGIFVRMSAQRPWNYLLAGTLLNPTTVLTIYGGEFGAPTRGPNYVIPHHDNIKVAGGLPSNSLSSKDIFSQEANVSSIFPFTRHRWDNKEYHLYLIHLDSPLGLDTPFVKAVCLPDIFDFPDLVNEKFYLGGYAPSGLKEKKFQVKKVDLIPEEDCKEEFHKFYKGSGKSIFCAKQSSTFYGANTCIHHGGTLFSSPDQQLFGNKRETRWYLTGILAIIPSLKLNNCNRESLYMVTNLEDSLGWLWQHLRCGPQSFPCSSGTCIEASLVCNGVPNCPTSPKNSNVPSDDENTIFCNATNHCRTKDSNFSPCGLFQKCIPPEQFCNGENDCGNGVDESPLNCHKNSNLGAPGMSKNVSDLSTNPNGLRGTCATVQLTEGVIASCQNVANNQIIPCSDAVANDIMILECDDQFKSNVRTNAVKMTCGYDGSWSPSRSFYCERECGIISSALTFKLSYGSSTNNKNSFPWYVALFRNQSSRFEFICGGSLIEKNIVVTAAHCVTKGNQLDAEGVYQVVLAPVSTEFADNKDDTFTQVLPVQAMYIPASYAPNNLQSDIALLELKRPAVYNDFVRPVCYLPPFYTDYPSPGIMGKVAGLGFDEKDRLSTVVKYSSFPVVSHETCIKALKHRPPLSTFCAGYQNGTAVCKGDSGGGFVFPVSNGVQQRYVLKGVVSHGLVTSSRFCDKENYSVFTHVDSFSDWITSVLDMVDSRSK